MAVSSTTTSVSYTGNGSTTVFPVPFKFLANGDLVVKRTPSGGSTSTLVLNADYTLSGAGVDGGGSLTMTSPLANLAALVITRVTAPTQTTDFASFGTFLPKVHETALDKAAMTVQETEARTGTLETQMASVQASIANGLNTTPSGDVTFNTVALTGNQLRAPTGKVELVENGGSPFDAVPYIDVRSRGAALDNTTDDAAALQAAVNAASAAGIGVVLIPKGTLLAKSSVAMPPGVTIVGLGKDVSKIRFQINSSTDGLVWTGYNFIAGGLRDVSLLASSQAHVRDLLVVNQWSSLRFKNVNFSGAGRRNIALLDVVDIKFDGCSSAGAYATDLYVNASIAVSTTVRFHDCHFTDTTNGPGADVSGNGLVFVGCDFEHNGTADVSAGYGITVRNGNVTLDGCYWENNSQWGINAGTTVAVGVLGTTLTVISPEFTPGALRQSGVGAIKTDYVTGGGVFGGRMNSSWADSISMSLHTSGWAIVGFICDNVFPNQPNYDLANGHTIQDYPGFVSMRDTGTGAFLMQSQALYGTTLALKTNATMGGTLGVTGNTSLGAKLTTNGARTRRWTQVSATGSMDDTHEVVYIDAASADVVYTLQRVAVVGQGRSIIIGRSGTVGHKVTIQPFSGDGFEINLPRITLEAGTWVELVCDPFTVWQIQSWTPGRMSASAAATMAGNSNLVLADATSAPFTVTLPPAGETIPGAPYTIKKKDATTNAVSVAAQGGSLIDFLNTAIVMTNPGDYVTLTSDGSSWWVLNSSTRGSIKGNTSGNVTISNSATSATVTFPTAEFDSGYGVILGCEAAGSPASGALRASISSKGTGGFTVNLEAAPGGGNSVQVDWMLVRA